MPYPIPFNEAARLRALADYQILDSEPERAFDLLTALARRHFDVPIALVSLVDEHRQWFKSADGLDVSETPRDVAFCAHAIASPRPMVVLDALEDPRFRHSTLVTGHPNIRFYAGAPLITPGGFRLGTFCVIDQVPRPAFGEEEERALEDFARLAVQVMELRRSRVPAVAAPTTDHAATAQMELFSVVAHEIRSPVAALSGFIQAFASEALGPIGNERHRHCAALMAETAEHIVQVTDRMLDFGSLKSGDVTISDELVLVPDLFAAACRMTRQAQATKGTVIEIGTVCGELGVTADKALTLQMLTNLMGNAVKYGPDGSTVSLTAERLESGALAIAVTDHGRGMSPDEIDAALKPYGRVLHQGEADPGGMGIGLPLVKKLIEAHGGRLELKSVEGRGTTAQLVFPSYRCHPAPLSPKDAA